MTNDKVNQVLRKYAENFRARGYSAKRLDADRVGPTPAEARSHAHWMAAEAQTFPEEKLEKKMRWLGFIQGVAWFLDGVPVKSLKEDNMPANETYDGDRDTAPSGHPPATTEPEPKFEVSKRMAKNDPAFVEKMESKGKDVSVVSSPPEHIAPSDAEPEEEDEG